MLVPKKEVDINKQRLKNFKKFSLELYQKQYRIYENELVMVPKPTKTNVKMIENIDSKVAHEKKPNKSKRTVKVQVKVEENTEEQNFFKRFDYFYNQSVNIALNDRLGFHLNANIQTKTGLGLYTINPSLSYKIRNSYYRVISKFSDLIMMKVRISLWT